MQDFALLKKGIGNDRIFSFNIYNDFCYRSLRNFMFIIFISFVLWVFWIVLKAFFFPDKEDDYTNPYL